MASQLHEILKNTWFFTPKMKLLHFVLLQLVMFINAGHHGIHWPGIF